MTQNRSHIFILLILGLVALFVIHENSKINESIRLEEEKKFEFAQRIGEVPVSAKAVSIYNIDRGEKVYGKNDEVPMPIASLVKIMTIASSVNQGNEDDLVTVTEEAIKQAGDYGLYVNEVFRTEDLAKITMVTSANDGAYALSARYLDFIERVNSKTHRLGAWSAEFLNPTGLDTEDEEGNSLSVNATASAEDVNRMAVYLLLGNPEISHATTLPELTVTSESGFTHTFKNTNILIGKIPNLLFSKTGYTDIAGGNLTVIFKNRAGESIAMTLLGSTFEGRFSDMEKLVAEVY